MKRLILNVQDKNKVLNLQQFCHIVYVSKFLNVIGVEIREADIPRLSQDPNVIHFTESDEGTFQSNVASSY